jgi:putative hydrolase of the HAD superfamily
MMFDPVSCLAFDFGGTLAEPGPSPTGELVAYAARRIGTKPPPSLPAAFDRSYALVIRADRRTGQQTPFPLVLESACGAAEWSGPPTDPWTETVFTLLPDATVDVEAAAAVRALHDRGYACLLACNTQRPPQARERTIAAAGLAGYFASVVLSSGLGWRKPNPVFYAALLAVAPCQAKRILYIGDTPDKDVAGPRQHGMQAALIHPNPQPAKMPVQVPVFGHVSELLDLLPGPARS